MGGHVATHCLNLGGMLGRPSLGGIDHLNGEYAIRPVLGKR